MSTCTIIQLMLYELYSHFSTVEYLSHFWAFSFNKLLFFFSISLISWSCPPVKVDWFLMWLFYFILFIFLTSLLEYNCFTGVCYFLFYIKVNQLYVYIYIPISPPSCTSLALSLSHPSRWTQSTELISLCYVAASH